MNYGGFWIRFLAYIVDSLIVTVGFIGIMLLLSVMGLELAGAGIIYWVFAILYWALMQSSKGQATIGKALCGLKVVGPNGERISVARSLAREAAKIISSLTLLIGFIIAAFTGKKQALHDFVATTYVVREGQSRVLVAVAVAVLAFFAPAIAVAMFGPGIVTSALGPMAAGILEQEAAMQKPAAQAPKPAAPKPAAMVTAAATPAAAAPSAPAPSASAPAKPVATAAPMQTPQASEPPKSAPAALKEPVKAAAPEPLAPAPAAEQPAPVAEAANKPEPPEAAPVARQEAQDEPAPAPRIRTVAAVESKIRFNDLMTAVLYRDAGTVNDLLAFGKWPDKPDSQGTTPLMVAASLGETAIAEALLKAGADPRRAGPNGSTAISIARERKDAAMLGLLQGKR